MVRLVFVQSVASTKITAPRLDASQSSILEHIYADGAVVVVATLAVEVVVALPSVFHSAVSFVLSLALP